MMANLLFGLSKPLVIVSPSIFHAMDPDLSSTKVTEILGLLGSGISSVL